MIAKYLALLETEIRKERFGDQPKSLYEPVRYIMTLGGKRLRPLLTLLSYSMYKENVAEVVRYAVAVEAFHNFTLLHDDIMDKAPLRRGKPTVHEKWNTNTAILSGDVMLVKVYEAFQQLEKEKLKQVLSLFNSCAAAVCEGQQWDMTFETKSKVTEAQYLEMIRLKTAVLLGFSLELGAVLADAPEEDRRILREVGINLGIGFQLKDDLLDVYADKNKFGKQVGGDILLNKKTFLLIKAQEKAKGSDKRDLQRWLTVGKFDKKKKIAAVSGLYTALGVQALAEQKILDYFEKGFAGLEKLSVKGKASGLIRFARDLAARER